MVEKDEIFQELDHLFSEARKSPVRMPDDLTQRILADAEMVQGGFAAPLPDPVAGRKPQAMFAQIRAVFGGWSALGGMVAASMVGVWIGVSPPEFATGVDGLLPVISGDLDLFDSYGLGSTLMEEG